MATYTDNYQLTKPTYAEQADIGVINSNMNKIDNIMHSSQISLAPAYDSTKAYAEGDKVMYELLMYKCISPTTGVWDGSKWERTTASESGGGGSAELDILGEASGAVASFADGASAGLAKCIAEIVPKQAGSGTPSPDNVRAISGYASAKVSVNGKNFLNFAVNSTINVNGLTLTPLGDGGFIINGTSTAAGILVWNVEMTDGGTSGTANQGKKNLPNGSYKFSILRDGLHTQVRGSNTSSGGDNPIATTVYGEDFTIDDTYRYNWIRIQFSGGVTFNNETFYPMIRLATESAEYEPYKGNITTTPLEQTVYGGQLNVLTGELTIDRAIITITSESQFTTFSADSTYGSLVTIASDGKTDNSNIMSISDMALGISNNDRVSPDYVSLDRCYIDDNGRVRLRASKDVTISTKADMLTRFLNAQVVYILATPQTVQLTPQEVNSLLGQNNISADTGDIDIVYVKASAPIQPNPTGEPTATLSKLGIEGTVFKIPSAGGGSSLINYSTSEQKTGRKWIDGKDIYERTYTGSFIVPSGGTWFDTGIALSDVENLIDTQSRQSIAKWNFISGLNNSGTLVLINPTGGSLTVESVTIQYTKITD